MKSLISPLTTNWLKTLKDLKFARIKNKHIAYQMDSYNYIGDSCDKKIEFKKKSRKINQGQNQPNKCNK